MKVNKLVRLTLVAISLVGIALAAAPPTLANPVVQAPEAPAVFVWNLAADFRVWPNQANPNPDSYGNPAVWSFLHTTAAHNPATYALDTAFYPNTGGNPGMQAWNGPEPTGFPNSGAPVVQMNTTGVPFFFANTTSPPGAIITHPATSQPAIVGWHSPFTGSVAITGGVTDLSTVCGDGILWFIDKNSSTVASGSYPNGGKQLFKDGNNGGKLANIAVNKGDYLYFLVAPGGNYCADGTQLDVTITAVTMNAPATPKLLAPPNNAVITQAGVLLDWSAVPFATRYRVTLLNSANVAIGTMVIYGASKVEVILPAHQTYYWHVKGCTIGGCSPVSPTWKFTN